MKVKNTQKVLIFTNKGNCYKTVAGNIPESKWKEKGNLLKTVDKKIASDEKVIKLFVLPEKFDDKELIFFTTDGMVKRSKFEEYDIAKAYFQAVKLKDGEEVVDVQEYQEKGSILFVSKQSMVLNFEKTDIPVQGRVSGGVKGMNLDQGDSVLYATQVDKSGFLTILTDKGVGKRISVAEFGLYARYRKGLRSISLGGKGKLIYAEFDYEKPSIAVSSNDKFKQLSEVPILSRTKKYDPL